MSSIIDVKRNSILNWDYKSPSDYKLEKGNVWRIECNYLLEIMADLWDYLASDRSIQKIKSPICTNQQLFRN
jgi:hypothetical protein